MRRKWKTKTTTVTLVPHGTLGGYTNHKCRCDECKKALAKNHKTYMAEIGGRFDTVTCKFLECRKKALKFGRGLCEEHYYIYHQTVKVRGIRTDEEFNFACK